MAERDFDERIGRLLGDLNVPADSEERTLEAVRRVQAERAGGEGEGRVAEDRQPEGGSPADDPAASSPGRARARTRWARRRRVLVASALILLVAAASALAVWRPWERDSAPQVPAGRVAAEQILADPLLTQLAWLVDRSGPDGAPVRIQELERMPSLRFPAGVGHAEAFRRLIESLSAEGRLPLDARLGPPLPAGRVVALPADPATEGVALDLTAARGYAIPGGVLPEGFAIPPEWDRERERVARERAAELGLVVPPGAIIPVPELAPCQILDPAAPAPPCELSPPLRR